MSAVTAIVRPLPGGAPAGLGSPALPGSKSHTQRALVLAGLPPGRCELRGALRCADTEVAAAALREVGAGCVFDGDSLRVSGAGWPTAGPHRLWLGENGTALRTLGAVLPMLGCAVELDGGPGLRRRPHAALVTALRAQGVAAGDGWPLRGDGRSAAWPDQVVVDGRVTTQVGSGFVLGAALRRRRGATAPGLIVVSAPAAPGYLRVTAAACRAFGVGVDVEVVGEDLWLSIGAVSAPPAAYDVPVDASAIAVPAVLAAMAGAEWQPPPRGEDPHPDWGVLADVERLRGAPAGAEVTIADLGSRPDTFPALAVLAARRTGETVLRGAPALRGKESDRIAAMARGLRAAGCSAEELTDGLRIHGPVRPRPAGGPIAVPAPADHRVVMALALLGAVVPGGVAVPHAGAVDKSWPGFWPWLGRVAVVCGAPPDAGHG